MKRKYWNYNLTECMQCWQAVTVRPVWRPFHLLKPKGLVVTTVRAGNIIFSLLICLLHSPPNIAVFISWRRSHKMNFINSWLAEPWEDTKIKINSDSILERQCTYEEAVVPNDAVFLTGGVDVQKDSMYYTVRAWGYGMTSWNLSVFGKNLLPEWPIPDCRRKTDTQYPSDHRYLQRKDLRYILCQFFISIQFILPGCVLEKWLMNF